MPSTLWVQEKYLSLRHDYPTVGDSRDSHKAPKTTEFLETLQTLYEHTTAYFNKKPDTSGTRENKIDYMDLVTAHLREAPRFYGQAVAKLPHVQNVDFMGDRPWRW